MGYRIFIYLSIYLAKYRNWHRPTTKKSILSWRPRMQNLAQAVENMLKKDSRYTTLLYYEWGQRA